MTYAIRPLKVDYKAGEWFSSWFSPFNMGCSGCVSSLLALGLVVWASTQNFFADKAFGAWFLRFAGCAFLIYLAATLVLYIGRKIKLSQAEAMRATHEAWTIKKGVGEHSAYLKYQAQLAADALKLAASEHQENAFAPFWDAIETAAAALGECYTSSQWFSANVPRYDEILRGRDHSFPDCFEGIEELPDCRPLLDELYRLVRLAQRDFHFSNIWEHRQTRKVLIAGFSTLGEAIRSLEATVQRSFADLKQTLAVRTLVTVASGTPGRVVLKLLLPQHPPEEK